MTHPLPDDRPQPSSWTGWVAFGAGMLMFAGLVHVFQGLIALLDDDYLLTPDGLAVDVPYSTLGWVYIGLGVVSLAIGGGMVLAVRAALVAGVVVAALSAIVHMATIAANPMWSVVVIAFDVIVIYAILTHGREMALVREVRSSPYAGEEAYAVRTR
jgi:hypothetical protein